MRSKTTARRYRTALRGGSINELAPSVVKFRADVIAKTLFQSEEILGTYRVKMKQRLSIRPFDITEGCPWDYDGDD